MSDWKPGDVAMAKAPSGVEFMAVRTGSTNPYWSAPMDWPVGISDYECEFRRLVVIDPDSAEDLDALVSALRLAAAGRGFSHVSLNSLFSDEQYDFVRDALRSLIAEPTPRIEEPTDPAARVIDKDGDEWARTVRTLGGRWSCLSSVPGDQTWDSLLKFYGPVEVVTP